MPKKTLAISVFVLFLGLPVHLPAQTPVPRPQPQTAAASPAVVQPAPVMKTGAPHPAQKLAALHHRRFWIFTAVAATAAAVVTGLIVYHRRPKFCGGCVGLLPEPVPN